MIEFIECHMNDGSMSARVKSAELPSGMRYTVTLWSDGAVTAQSRANGDGSVRYYTHRTYAEALAHGYTWAQRKIDEARRARNHAEMERAVQHVANTLGA